MERHKVCGQVINDGYCFYCDKQATLTQLQGEATEE